MFSLDFFSDLMGLPMLEEPVVGGGCRVGLHPSSCVSIPLKDVEVWSNSKDVVRFADLGPSSIFAAARENGVTWGTNKAEHIALYCQDVQRFQQYNGQVAAHAPFANLGTDDAAQTLRVMSWNVNNLCGLMSNSDPGDQPNPPEDFADVIRWLQPDVIVLQEMVSEARHYDDAQFARACSRVKDLEGILEADGFSICKSTCGNPTLLATKLVITEMESFNLDRHHQWRTKVSTTPGKLMRDAQGQKKEVNESRAALYVKVACGGGLDLGIYATHLHHRNYTKSSDGARAAEMRVLLDHQALRKDAAALVVADFNQPHERDYSRADWNIMVKSSVEDVVADDGVDDLLQREGFKVCWDLPGLRNFSGTGAPPLTHWSGTTVDHVYLQSRMKFLKLVAAFVGFNSLSDHLPVVVDISIDKSKMALG